MAMSVISKLGCPFSSLWLSHLFFFFSLPLVPQDHVERAWRISRADNMQEEELRDLASGKTPGQPPSRREKTPVPRGLAQGAGHVPTP